MWQRVQTLYLAIATALVASLFFSFKAVVYGAGGDADFVKYTTYIPYLALIIVSALLEFLALTTWGHRIFQMRTAILSSIILLALQAWLAVDYFSAPDAEVFRFTAIFPAVAVVFNLLAARSIYADELLVQSASRLRAAKRKKK